MFDPLYFLLILEFILKQHEEVKKKLKSLREQSLTHISLLPHVKQLGTFNVNSCSLQKLKHRTISYRWTVNTVLYNVRTIILFQKYDSWLPLSLQICLIKRPEILSN